MEIRINNILDLQLTNDDVNSFIDVFGTLKNEIHAQQNKVGFKKKGKVTIELQEETIEFIVAVCDSAGILSETESNEQETESTK
tara:strand:- start:42900 stop:43151 length:252 start_codon:yes stop_codon:yes gene_type:complete